jgi:osmotically-inducible protein OsmY
MKTLFLLIVAAVIGAVVFMGCAKDQAGDAQKQVTEGASKAWDKTKDAASSVGKTISKTADQMEETAKIKGPIDATKDIDSSKMSVTTIDKTVYLAGFVPTADQKSRVEQMVHVNIDKGFKLEDNLKVVAVQKDDTKKAPKADDSGPQ